MPWQSIGLSPIEGSLACGPAFSFGWLEPTGAVLGATLLILFCVVAWGLNLFTLPGNWMGVAAIACYSLVGPEAGRAGVGYLPVVAAFVLALIGEVTEFLASAVGAKRAGASRKSTLCAVAGSMIGAISGAIIGVPIPVVGSIVAAVLFGGLGATAGAMFGEWTDGREWRESWQIGRAAFWGRTFGVLGKTLMGLGVVVVAILAVLF